jgi:hypothetical protein
MKGRAPLKTLPDPKKHTGKTEPVGAAGIARGYICISNAGIVVLHWL